jgi:hypothetical protein
MDAVPRQDFVGADTDLRRRWRYFHTIAPFGRDEVSAAEARPQLNGATVAE